LRGLSSRCFLFSQLLLLLLRSLSSLLHSGIQLLCCHLNHFADIRQR
jgi:hypothetical protein